MSEKKHEKASRGRHAGASNADSKPQQNAQPAVQPPDGTAVKPQTVKPVNVKQGVQPPLRYASDEAYPAGAPMRPVDTAQAAQRGRKHKPLKIVGIALGVLLALLLVAYAAVAVYFTGRFMPNSTIGDLDVSLMSSADAEKVLANAIDDYKLSMDGDGFSLELTSSDAGLSFDEGAVVQDMLSDMNPWLWPLELRKDHDETAKLVATYNETGLGDTLRAAVEEFNESAEQPVDASIGYDEKKSAFVVNPESTGTALDPDAVIKAVDAALAALDPQVKLTDEQLLQPTVLSTDQKLVSAAAEANTMIKADLKLQMAGDTAAEVNADLVSKWVKLDKDLKASLDEKALTEWVDELAGDCNTVGSERTYTRPDGKTITVSGGVYGWAVDRDKLLEIVKGAVAEGRTDTVDIPCSSTGNAYNGAGKQDWGARYVDIDLAEQHVRFYDESGSLVWESDCVSGIPDGVHDTSVGVFWLNAKQSPSKLIGYENGKKIYESTVQYWMPFDGNAIGLHDADWQPAFGGSCYKNGAGSHGCVNLPPSKAQELYGLVQEGDVVVSHW